MERKDREEQRWEIISDTTHVVTAKGADLKELVGKRNTEATFNALVSIINNAGLALECLLPLMGERDAPKPKVVSFDEMLSWIYRKPEGEDKRNANENTDSRDC